jgi:hypothetical protein
MGAHGRYSHGILSEFSENISKIGHGGTFLTQLKVVIDTLYST